MQIDEDAFLADLIAGLSMPPAVIVPPGDDCAAVEWRGDRLLLMAVDQVAAGVHYYGREAATPTPPHLAGRKLLARNLSDIAAMGGRPRYALLAIAVTADCPRDWVDAFAKGVNDLAVSTSTAMIGGDLGRGGSDVASLTILGEVDRQHLLLRQAAKPGDAILVTGCFGASLASGHHLTFEPRLQEGEWLAAHGATSGIDVSDGLLKDLERVCHASGCAARLELAAIPRRELAGQPAELSQALLDGEDYELIVGVPSAVVEQLLADWPFATPLTRIGSFVSAATSEVCDHAGLPLRDHYPASFTHFDS